MAPKRVRVVRYIVQPVVMLDDGNNLTELPIDPVVVQGGAFEDWAFNGLPDALSRLQAEVNADQDTGDQGDDATDDLAGDG